jgi:hypothetical protein
MLNGNIFITHKRKMKMNIEIRNCLLLFSQRGACRNTLAGLDQPKRRARGNSSSAQTPVWDGALTF